MKLLFISPRIPYPPDKGDRVRSSHELQAFIERGHEVHLLAFADDLNDLNYRLDLGRMCATVEIIPLRRVWAVARARQSGPPAPARARLLRVAKDAAAGQARGLRQ